MAGDLTEAEAAVYDRQLRVWGVEVQKRLNAAKILIVGGDGVAAEVAKNIVLAGVGEMGLFDTTTLADSYPGNFLLPSDVSTTASVACTMAATLAEMNPLVRVSSVAGGTIDQLADLVRGYHVALLCAPYTALSTLIAFDAACAEQGVAMYAAVSRGSTSFFFANLHSHTYTPVVPEGKEAMESSHCYATLHEAIFQPWNKLHPRRTHKLFYAVRACAEFERKVGHFPGKGELLEVERLAKVIAEEDEVSTSVVALDFVHEYVLGVEQYAAVNAILGGVLATEMLKAVSCRGEPFNNMFFFCLSDGAGVVECIGKQE